MNTSHSSRSLTSLTNYTTPIQRLCNKTIILILVFLVLVFVLLILSTVVKSGRDTMEYDTAEKVNVLDEYSQLMNDSIDHSVNTPCVDYFQYACGNWALVHQAYITPQVAQLDHGALLTRKTNLELQQAIKNEIIKGTHAKRIESKAVRYLLDLYCECVDEKQRNKLGTGPMRTQIQQLISANWPVINRDRAQTLHDRRWMDLFVDFFVVGISPIFSIKIDNHPTLAKVKIIKISKSKSVKFGSPKKYNDSNLENKFFEIVLHLMGRIFPLPTNVTRLKKVHKAIHDMIHFEAQLAKHATNITNGTIISSLASLNRYTKYRIDWIQLLNRYATRTNSTKRFTNEDKVVVADLNYLIGMADTLMHTPLQVIKNFLVWMFVFDYQHLLDNQTRQSWTNGDDPSRYLPSWKRCLNLFQQSNLFTLPISWLYVMHHSQGNLSTLDDIKTKVTDLIRDLKYSYKVMLQSEESRWTWLDNGTRQKALTKLDAMTEMVGFTDWILDPVEVDRRYSLHGVEMQVIKGQFFVSYIQWLSHYMTVRFQNIQINERVHWFKHFSAINSFYYQLKNHIFVPLGILQPPFFHLDYPDVINFAAIGSILGHEIGHAFDFQGHNHDEHGNRVNWWSNYSKTEFYRRAQCFKSQYNDIIEESTGKNLDGCKCLSENIADNSGIRRAFAAWQHHLAHSPTTKSLSPHFPHLTPEKLFFQAYAQIWCGYYKNDYLQYLIGSDWHAPNKYRVNVPLINFDEFSKAYQCPSGSPMNPVVERKCKLW